MTHNEGPEVDLIAELCIDWAALVRLVDSLFCHTELL